MAGLPDIEKLCMNCMNSKPNAAAPCPHCGFPAGEVAASSEELPPRTILFGRYLLGRVAGRSDTGILYAAYDLKRCQRVTIREYFPKAYAKREHIRPGVSRVVPLSEEAASLFQSGLEQCTKKAQQLMRLGALSGLFAPKKCFPENGTVYAVLDYVQGVPLRQRIEENGGSHANAAALMQPLVNSLAQMHGASVSHGEVSLGQILFTCEGTLRLLPPWGAFERDDNHPGLIKGAAGGNARFTQDTRALCAALYTLLAGKEPPPLSSCEKMKDIPSLADAGVPISRQTERTIAKGLCGGYQDARALHWALYGTAPQEAGVVRGRDNNATVSLEKAVKTISGTSGKNKAPKKQNASLCLAIYAAFSLLQLAGAVYFMARGYGYGMYALLACALLNGLRLFRKFASPLTRVLHLVLAVGAAAFVEYAFFALTPEHAAIKGILTVATALLLLNAVFVLIEMVQARRARKDTIL